MQPQKNHNLERMKQAVQAKPASAAKPRGKPTPKPALPAAKPKEPRVPFRLPDRTHFDAWYDASAGVWRGHLYQTDGKGEMVFEYRSQKKGIHHLIVEMGKKCYEEHVKAQVPDPTTAATPPTSGT